ncbi:MAG: GTP 3',8-cyclase MoaA [Elusimicrobia bacterium]|nr:GTP 3',8-cyclase MoaA [Elusimicrobiota bacterium]
MTDGFGRKIDYLRLSVTDRCNLRCVYCLPERYTHFSPAGEILSDEEVLKLLSCFAELGISKVRITGGEPLVRQGIAGLIQRVSKIAGIADISLSTNGTLLAKMVHELAQAGLKRVNVSLDSLRSERFAQITRFGKLAAISEGIESALQAGLSPVKLNCVIARGMNDEEIGDFVKLTEGRPLHVRLIELMPMGETGFFSKERWVPLQEIMEKAAPIEPLPVEAWPFGRGPARYYRRPGAKGTVGFISALSCGFCSSCNRVRLTAKGTLVPCLDASEGVDLRTPLRGGASRKDIQQLILSAVRKKPARHHMLERALGAGRNSRYMCQVGG